MNTLSIKRAYLQHECANTHVVLYWYLNVLSWLIGDYAFGMIFDYIYYENILWILGIRQFYTGVLFKLNEFGYDITLFESSHTQPDEIQDAEHYSHIRIGYVVVLL